MNRLGWFLVMVSVAVIVVALHDLSADTEIVVDNASVSIESPASNHTSILSTTNTADIDTSVDVSNSKNEVDVVTRWMLSATNGDQGERTSADDRLLNARRDEILPALHNFIVSGSTDQRQLALNALFMLALKQGDADGEIQNILRLTSYDGDGALAGQAQLVLENIESSVTMTR